MGEPRSATGDYRFYEGSSFLFDVRYAQKDYAAESAMLGSVLAALVPGAGSLLDVACGTGAHLEHLQRLMSVEGLDYNPDLLAVAASRLGDVPLHEADMTHFDLGRTFDVVTCLFASLPYLGALDKMQAAVGEMTRHLAPDGLMVIEPWLTPDMYWENRVVHNYRESGDEKVSWMYVQRRVGNLAVWDIHWMHGQPTGVTHWVEREEIALFTTEEMTSTLMSVGLHVLYHPRGLHGYGMYLARRDPWTQAESLAVSEILAG